MIGGWRHLVRALERRETVAYLYVVPDAAVVLRHARAAGRDENALTRCLHYHNHEFGNAPSEAGDEKVIYEFELAGARKRKIPLRI